MARVTKKQHGNPWRPKKEDETYSRVETRDGTKYTIHLPNFNQRDAFQKSLQKYKDVFDQIKADVKKGDAILGNGLPDLDHVAWAELLSSTFKKLNKTWGVNDKVWIYNKLHDQNPDHIAIYIAITPNITQRNAIRTAKKVSAKKVSAATNSHFHSVVLRDEDIVFGEPLPPITQQFFVKTAFNGNKYYYLNEADAREGNMNYDHVDEYVSEDDESITSEEYEDEDEEGEKSSKGGKRTRKHLRRKSTTTRRKTTTTRRK